MTPAQARSLVDAFEIEGTLDDPEEIEWFQRHHADLLDAYHALVALGKEDHPTIKGPHIRGADGPLT